jgi:hypothetical protein
MNEIFCFTQNSQIPIIHTTLGSSLIWCSILQMTFFHEKFFVKYFEAQNKLQPDTSLFVLFFIFYLFLLKKFEIFLKHSRQKIMNITYVTSGDA